MRFEAELLAMKLVGRRIRLVDTEDPYSFLRSGDMGTITDVCDTFEDTDTPIQLWVNWDRQGSKLCLLSGIDHYELIDT